MMKFAVVIAILFSSLNAEYTSLVWSSCSTATQIPAIRLERLTASPMVKINQF
jgi:hypothetical protein